MKSSKIFYTVTIVASLIVMILGSSFAYFAATVKTEDEETIAKSADYSLNLSVTPLEPAPENGPYTLIPMKDELSEKAFVGYNNVPCVDKNDAVVCYIYEIIVNEYNTNLEYLSGSLNITTSNISSLSYRLYDENNNPLAIDTDEEGNDIYYNMIISEEEMPLGDAFYTKDTDHLTLKLMIWLTDTGISQNETDIGSFDGSVTFYAGKGGKITGKISSLIEGNFVG